MNAFTALSLAVRTIEVVQVLHSCSVAATEVHHWHYSALVTYLWLQAWRRTTSGTCPGWFAPTCCTRHSTWCHHLSALSGGDGELLYPLLFLV